MPQAKMPQFVEDWLIVHTLEIVVPEPTWQESYKAALREPDPEKVNDRIKTAREAVYQRLMEDEPITQEEREKINDALRKLYLLTGGSGSA